jgi:uncharacterized RDD family membrane protein YckC
MTYATFWQRFAAMWVDGFILLPFMLLFGWLEAESKSLAYLIPLPRWVLFAGYHIFCHGRFGQTVGKYTMGIRLVQTDGKSITWYQAWLRSSVDLIFGLLAICSHVIALSRIEETAYQTMSWNEQMKAIIDGAPVWLSWVGTASQIWIWSEVIVMLFNKKRRALHDFIAGTVVISTRGRKASPSWPQFAD